jgi:hypothetical protein
MGGKTNSGTENVGISAQRPVRIDKIAVLKEGSEK